MSAPNRQQLPLWFLLGEWFMSLLRNDKQNKCLLRRITEGQLENRRRATGIILLLFDPWQLEGISHMGQRQSGGGRWVPGKTTEGNRGRVESLVRVLAFIPKRHIPWQPVNGLHKQVLQSRTWGRKVYICVASDSKIHPFLKKSHSQIKIWVGVWLSGKALCQAWAQSSTEKRRKEKSIIILVCSVTCVYTGTGTQEENTQGVVAHDYNPSQLGR